MWWWWRWWWTGDVRGVDGSISGDYVDGSGDGGDSGDGGNDDGSICEIRVESVVIVVVMMVILLFLEEAMMVEMAGMIVGVYKWPNW